MTHRLDLLERLAELVWGPAVRRSQQAGLRLDHHLAQGHEVVVVSGVRGGLAVVAKVPAPDQVDGVVYDADDARARLRERVLSTLPAVGSPPSLLTFTGDPALDCWAGVGVDPQQCSITGLEQYRRGVLALVEEQVRWLQTPPPAGTSHEIAQAVRDVEAELKARGYGSLNLHRWAGQVDLQDDRVGVHQGSDRWVFGCYPEFARFGPLSPEPFLAINRARLPCDSCVVELDDDAVRFAGATGWLAFLLELPAAAGPGDAELIPALEQAFSATDKLWTRDILPRDMFGVHRPLTVAVSRVDGSHAAFVEPLPTHDAAWSERTQPLAPHPRLTAALGRLLEDLQNPAAYERMWDEVVDVLRWHYFDRH